MPKLLAYLPCEKVVVEEQSKNVSVLSILETVTVSLAPGAPAGESGRFPIWTPGICQLKLMLKIARDPDFRPLASVLIMLRHARS
jgi:hypothetical protein